MRNARQVAHPHVCRVYDIGEAGGRHFLSMEFVDGEDLATLLHRIGRLPPRKAVEVARQLCAGLAAAHDRGVLHRDLKPANVMLDGHGRARITDFGLAVRAEEAGTAELAGTPAYMSPEQLAGGPATVQSDLYALGLVLYEIFTGKRAFEASTFAEWRRKHTEDPPAHPSLHIGDLDPAVERVILRCLEKDPAKRPRSAAQVAQALPGGDPLAAAIAAGETPSPEMVAAAGGEGALAPRTAWMLLGGIVVLAAAVLALAPFSTDMGLAPWDKSPAVLRDRAGQIAVRLGYEAQSGRFGVVDEPQLRAPALPGGQPARSRLEADRPPDGSADPVPLSAEPAAPGHEGPGRQGVGDRSRPRGLRHGVPRHRWRRPPAELPSGAGRAGVGAASGARGVRLAAGLRRGGAGLRAVPACRPPMDSVGPVRRARRMDRHPSAASGDAADRDRRGVPRKAGALSGPRPVVEARAHGSRFRPAVPRTSPGRPSPSRSSP